MALRAIKEGAMSTPYTHRHLSEIEDAAEKFGFAETQEARFANAALETEQTGFSLYRLKPGKRQPFGHRHERAEEVYVVLSGTGRMKLDDDVLELRPLDAIRVSPDVTRSFEAGADGLEVLAFGARQDGDRGELIMGWWAD